MIYSTKFGSKRTNTLSIFPGSLSARRIVVLDVKKRYKHAYKLLFDFLYKWKKKTESQNEFPNKKCQLEFVICQIRHVVLNVLWPLKTKTNQLLI